MPLIPLALFLMLGQDPLSDPTLDVKVTFRQDACSLPKLVGALAAASKSKLSAVTSLENQIVLIDVKDVRLSDAMSKLAEVTDCDWKADANGFTLAASVSKRAAREQEGVQERLTIVKKTIGDLQEIADGKYDASAVANYLKDLQRKSTDRSRYDSPEDLASTYNVRQEYGSGLPTGRSFARAILKIDPVLIASLRCDERVVFSTAPNKMQRPLTLDIGKETALRLRDAAVYKEGAKLAGLDQGTSAPGDPEEFVERGAPPHHEEPADVPDRKIAKIELIASRMQQMFGVDGIAIQYRLLDANGFVFDQHSIQVPLDASKMAMISEGPPQNFAPKYDAKPDSLWHWKLLTSMINAETSDTKDPRLSSIILHPEKSEPLSYLTSDVLVAASRNAGANIIAEVNDFALVLCAAKGADGSDFAQFRKRVLPTCFIDLSKDPSWSLLQPRTISTERDNRIDRTGLGMFLRNPSKTDLATFAEYAARRKANSPFNFVELAYLMASAGSRDLQGIASIESLGHPALCYLGGMDPQTRQSFINGATMTYGRSPDFQKRMLEKLAFGAAGVATLTFDQGPEAGSDGIDQTNEPTDLMPLGIPFDATAHISHADQPVLYTLDSDGKTWNRTEIWELAMIIAKAKNPKLRFKGADGPFPTKFKVGANRIYDFRFYVSKVAYYNFSYSELLSSSNAPVCSYQQLPLDIRKQIEDDAKRVDQGGDFEDAPIPTESGSTGGGGGGL